jgi:Peptidase A4 family
MPVVSLSCSSQGSNCQAPTPMWAGYQLCDGYNSGGPYCTSPPSNTIQAVYGSFAQPNIYIPTGNNQPGCGTVACTFSTWVALDTYAPGGSSILQTGSIGVMTFCEISCITNYGVFWEDYEGSGSATICSWAPSPGDTITPVVQWSSGNSYYVYTTDTTKSKSCTSSPYPYTYSHTPLWGDFIIERQRGGQGGISGQDLAKFDNFWSPTATSRRRTGSWQAVVSPSRPSASSSTKSHHRWLACTSRYPSGSAIAPGQIHPRDA